MARASGGESLRFGSRIGLWRRGQRRARGPKLPTNPQLKEFDLVGREADRLQV